MNGISDNLHCKQDDYIQKYLHPFFSKLKVYFGEKPLPITKLVWKITYCEETILIIFAKKLLGLFEEYQQSSNTIITVEWYYVENEEEVYSLIMEGEELKKFSKLEFSILPWDGDSSGYLPSM